MIFKTHGIWNPPPQQIQHYFLLNCINVFWMWLVIYFYWFTKIRCPKSNFNLLYQVALKKEKYELTWDLWFKDPDSSPSGLLFQANSLNLPEPQVSHFQMEVTL